MMKKNLIICPLCDKECDSKGILGHILFMHKIKLKKLADVGTLLSNIKGFSRISGISAKPSIVTGAQDIDTRTASSSNCNPEIPKPQQVDPNILSYKENGLINLNGTGDKKMSPTPAGPPNVKPKPSLDLAERPWQRMPWGSYPEGAEKCFSCDRYFWKADMKPGYYCASCLYCIDCYEAIRRLSTQTH